MRELRESLRHAALLNIVAAANSDACFSDPPPAQQPRPYLQGTAPSQLVPPHHPHHHQRPSPSPLALQVTTSRGSPFPQTTEGGGRSAGSGAYHSSSRDSGGCSPSPNTLVANLLSPRMRTISIPRPGPRAHDLPGPFIHKSVTQAKECLSRVGEMVRSRGTDGAEAGERGASQVATPNTHDLAVMRGSGTSAPGVVLPVQGHALEPQRHHAPGGISSNSNNNTASQEEARNTPATPFKATSTQSLDSSTITIAAPSQSASIASDSSRTTTTDARSAGTGRGGGRGSGEERTGSSAQQMANVRRHLTPGKKRELVKRLTEMAKCEAVDMTDPLAGNDDGNAHFMPPMIILSQQRQEIRYPEDSLPVAAGGYASSPQLASVSVDSDVNSAARAGGGLYRTKSLSSLIASNNYSSPTRGKGLSQRDAQSRHKTGSLECAQSGSMPDLATEAPHLDASSKAKATEHVSPSPGRVAAESLFTDGIVGKNIQREAEGRKGLTESRPLLPATPTYRPRRGTRPSGRRSSLGLRDRGPVDPPAPTVTTTTSVLTLAPGGQAPNRSKTGNVSSESQLPGPVPPYCQTLPTLTITGLHHERSPPGAATSNSRAARELRPASKSGVSSSMQLFQQLDDQCEKLQRQLNISLNVPRRAPHWQVT